jgi:hypothetical protein
MALRKRFLSSALFAGGLCGLLLGSRPATPAHAYGTIPYSLDGIIPPSPYHVPAAVVAQYCGRYNLRSIDWRTRLTSGYIDIARRADGSLLGLVMFYGYDPRGFQTSWLAVLSDFHVLPHHMMAIDLLSQAGQQLGDQLMVTRGTHGDLVGRLLLDGHEDAVRWHKTAG